MKVCRDCGKEKELTEFNVSSRSKDGRSTQCKLCRRIYDNEHYAKSEKRKTGIKDHNKRVRREIQKWLWQYLLEHPCPCGESDPRVLTFDHRDGSDKKFNLGHFQNRGWAAVKREVAKCDVLCANCHLRRTATQFGWYAFVAQG